MHLTSSFSFSLASIAALRIGRYKQVHSYSSACLCHPFVRYQQVRPIRLVSEHSKGYRKLNGLFRNFPDAVRTVTARTSLSLLVMSSSIIPNFQVPVGELFFGSTTSPFVGKVR